MERRNFAKRACFAAICGAMAGFLLLTFALRARWVPQKPGYSAEVVFMHALVPGAARAWWCASALEGLWGVALCICAVLALSTAPPREPRRA
jgi:hypothetical protein